jgi:hypothetical protein
MLQESRWSFHNFVLLVIWKWIIIGMEVLDEKLGSAFRARLDDIEIVCVRCTVDVGTVGTIIDLNGRETNKWTLWRG